LAYYVGQEVFPKITDSAVIVFYGQKQQHTALCYIHSADLAHNSRDTLHQTELNGAIQ